jgi:hypothetical protein
MHDLLLSHPSLPFEAVMTFFIRLVRSVLIISKRGRDGMLHQTRRLAESASPMFAPLLASLLSLHHLGMTGVFLAPQFNHTPLVTI